MAKTIQIRRDTAANWANINPTLSEGELGMEVDTGLMKIGHGSKAWNLLEYINQVRIFTGPTPPPDPAINDIWYQF